MTSASATWQVNRSASLFEEFDRIFVERGENIAAKPLAMVGENTIGEIAARLHDGETRLYC